MATKTIGYDNSGVAGDYTTLAAYLAYLQAGGNSGSSGTLGEAEVGDLMWGTSTPSTAFAANLDITGVGTSASNTLTLRAKSGYGFKDDAGAATNPLRVDPAKGACLSLATNYLLYMIRWTCNYLTIQGLQIRATGNQVPALVGSTVTNCTVDGCILQVKDPLDAVVMGGANNTLKRSAIILTGNLSTSRGTTLGSGGTVDRNTIVRSANQTATSTGVRASYGAITARGNVVCGFTTAFGNLSGSYASSSDYNATEQSATGTAQGTHNLVSQTFSALFQNNGSGGSASIDLRIPSSSALKDAGVTITGISTDILGVTVPQGTTPDIGAHEYPVAADVTPPVVASANVDAAGTTLTIAFTEAGSPPVLPASSVIGFTLNASGGAVTLSSTAISSTTYTATTSRTIASGETLTLDYAAGNVTDSATTPNALAGFTGTAATNNSTQSPSLSAGAATSATTKVTVAATAASGGTGSITYQWYGSTTSGFTPGGGNLLSGQTGQNLTDYTVTGGSTYYFVRRATDGASTTADTSQFTYSAVSGSGTTATGSRGRVVNA